MRKSYPLRSKGKLVETLALEPVRRKKKKTAEQGDTSKTLSESSVDSEDSQKTTIKKFSLGKVDSQDEKMTKQEDDTTPQWAEIQI